MATSGGQPGNQNAAKGKRWKSVIEQRLAELAAMEKVADALILKACDGDVSAIKEIGDRLDGKPKQQTEISGPDGGAFQFQKIERVVTDPKN